MCDLFNCMFVCHGPKLKQLDVCHFSSPCLPFHTAHRPGLQVATSKTHLRKVKFRSKELLHLSPLVAGHGWLGSVGAWVRVAVVLGSCLPLSPFMCGWADWSWQGFGCLSFLISLGVVLNLSTLVSVISDWGVGCLFLRFMWG